MSESKKSRFTVQLSRFISRLATNVQRWPQDPYFPFSSFVLHLSEVWKCEVALLSFLIPSSTLLRCVEVWNSHTFTLVSKPLVILYLVLHFSEVWKCGKVAEKSPGKENEIFVAEAHRSVPWEI